MTGDEILPHEPTGWRREPRFTIVASAIGIGTATYFLYAVGATTWICVIAGFALGVLAGLNIEGWRSARMIDEVAARVAQDVKTMLLEDPDVEVIEPDRNGG